MINQLMQFDDEEVTIEADMEKEAQPPIEEWIEF